VADGCPTTGSTRGRGDGHGTAFLLKCGDDDLICNGTGDFISGKLTSEGYSETGRFHAIDPTGTTMGRDYVWTFPAIADGRLYLRNEREVICYDISKQVESSPVKASRSKSFTRQITRKADRCRDACPDERRRVWFRSEKFVCNPESGFST